MSSPLQTVPPREACHPPHTAPTAWHGEYPQFLWKPFSDHARELMLVAFDQQPVGDMTHDNGNGNVEG